MFDEDEYEEPRKKSWLEHGLEAVIIVIAVVSLVFMALALIAEQILRYFF